MIYLLFLVISIAAWSFDLILQSFYYFGSSPFGGDMITSDLHRLYRIALYYSGCFYALFSLPAIIALSIRKARFNKKRIINKKNTDNQKKSDSKNTDEIKFTIPGWIYYLHIVLLTGLILTNHFDHEIYRFMGTRYTLEMLKSYNVFSDTASFAMKALSTDARGAFSTLWLCAFPAVFVTLTLMFRKRICKRACSFDEAHSPILQRCSHIVVYVALLALIGSALSVFIKNNPQLGVRWQPNRTQVRVSPIYIALIEDIREMVRLGTHEQANYTNIASDIAAFQQAWLAQDPGNDWEFISPDYPFEKHRVSPCKLQYSERRPNIVVIFIETMRAMNLPDFNPDVKKDPMPFLHSLITGESEIMQKHGMRSMWYNHYTTSGLPTVDAQMSAHTGLPAHSFFTVSSTFTLDKFKTYASILKDNGYHTTFIDSADGGFTNWSMWIHRWYDQFLDMMTSDDKVTFAALGDLILERRRIEQPYLITAISISNHMPFDVPAGGEQPPENAVLAERIPYTLRYSDDQLKSLFEKLDSQDGLSNTVFIILGDHGYSLDDIPREEYFGENYETLRYNVAWVPFVMVSDLQNMPVGVQTHVAAHTDVAPTILDIAGVCDDNGFVGHSLMKPAPHHVLVNKNSNTLYRNDDYTAIYVPDQRAQLFKTDDLLQKEDLWQQQADVAESMRKAAMQFRTVVDYAYEMKRMKYIDSESAN